MPGHVGTLAKPVSSAEQSLAVGAEAQWEKQQDRDAAQSVSEAAVVPATAAPSHDAAVWPVPRLCWLPAGTTWAALVCNPARDAVGLQELAEAW